MSGEFARAKQLLGELMTEVEASSCYTADSMLRAVITEAVELMKNNRSEADIHRELSYLIDSLSENEPVITRGC